MKFNIDFWLIICIPAYFVFMIFAIMGSVLVANEFSISFLPSLVGISMVSYLLLILIKIMSSQTKPKEKVE